MRELTLHLLDLIENSVAAGATAIKLRIVEDLHTDILSFEVKDNGRGMSPDLVQQVVDPFITSRTSRKVGLGIPLLKAAAEICQGDLTIQSSLGVGTRIYVLFQHSHIDRMPLGDLSSTFLTLLVAHPDIHWHLTYHKYNHINQLVIDFDLDDTLIKTTLQDVPLSHPDVIAYLRQLIQTGLQPIPTPDPQSTQGE